MNDLVSIITPLYNAVGFVEQTIQSVLAQTYPRWEMIVVNDGSTDGSELIVERYSKADNRIVLINQPRQGSAVARNTALRSAQGRYIAFLDADDLWTPDFLQLQIKFLNETKLPIVYSGYKRIDENNQECLSPFMPPARVNYKDLLKTCPIAPSTVLYDANAIGKIYMNEKDSLGMREDYVVWLNIVQQTGFINCNRQYLAYYRIRNSQKSGSKIRMIIPQYRVYRQAEHLNPVQSLYYLACWACNGIRKYIK